MKKIILTALLICMFGQVIFSQNQTATVTGKVTNEKNEPIPYVTIKVKNGKAGALTDIQGKFSLKVASFPVTLEISSTGFTAHEVNVATAGEISVTLQTFETGLDPVVIGINKVEGKLTSQASFN